jgi:hypothetical protein
MHCRCYVNGRFELSCLSLEQAFRVFAPYWP